MGMNRLVLTLLIAAAPAVPAVAQNTPAPESNPLRLQDLPPQNAAPEVILAQNGADNLLSDLEFVLMLTSPEEQKQWTDLKEYIELFLIGVDRTRPNRVDFILQDSPSGPRAKDGGVAEVKATADEPANGKGEKKKKKFTPSTMYRMRLAVPVSNLAEFREDNLEGIGVDTLRRSSAHLYEARDAFVGWMRYKEGYAIFAEKKDDIPFTLPDPARIIQPLVRKYDLAGVGANLKTDTKSIEERRDWAGEQRNDILGRLQQRKEETKDEFALRKMLSGHLLDEVQRIYAEGLDVHLGWNTLVREREGRLEGDLTAIPETSLAETIRTAGREPSRFAAIPQSKGSILSARLNWPLDEMRQENLLELFEFAHAQSLEDIEADETRGKEEKEAARELADRVLRFFETNTRAGLADGFVETHANASGKHTAIGGFKAADGHSVVEILELIPKARKGQTVEIDVDKAGGVRIHRAPIDVEKHVHFQEFLGTDVVYVGTEKDAVWFAAGENALDELKGAIEASGKPPAGKPGDRFATLFVKFLPWLELRDKRAGKEGDPELRRKAIEAFRQGDDTLALQLSRTPGDRIVGDMVADTGILRLAGKMIAQFTKENLAE